MRYSYQDSYKGISLNLKLYYKGRSVGEIAKKRGVSTQSMAVTLSSERKRLGLKPLPRKVHCVQKFLKDEEIIMSLRSNGMTLSKIAAKWKVSHGYAEKKIKEWSPEKSGVMVKSTSFNVNDETLPSEFFITRYGQPMFKVTRL